MGFWWAGCFILEWVMGSVPDQGNKNQWPETAAAVRSDSRKNVSIIANAYVVVTINKILF